MKTSRRTFLRVLGSAIVGAAVAPALPTAVIMDPEPLTDAFVQASYSSSRLRGLDRLIARSMKRRQTIARETGLIYDVEIAA